VSVLNDHEFHQQALAGGASRHFVSGHEPETGYMVGGARDLSDNPYPEIKHPVDSFDLNHVRQHARDLRDKFDPKTQMISQGAWREGDHVVLDASERINTFSSAITAAKMRGERAIYDVRRGREHHVEDMQRKVRN
jgi:hypothetical protein